jgi:hypothetical protein
MEKDERIGTSSRILRYQREPRVGVSFICPTR